VGVLLINLGTPDAPEAPEVRRYLREFLNDPRVLDLHPLGRWLLLNLVILPFRPRRSAEAYRKVWTEEGAPLLVHSERLTQQIAQRLPDAHVVLGMRYGKPSIGDAMRQLREQGCERILVAPLYPQYASSSTGTALECVYREAGALWNTPSISVLPPFYDHPAFIRACAEVARPLIARFEPDHLLFSYHGLPERHIRKSDPTGGYCLKNADCCAAMGVENRACYKAQCYATTRALVSALGADLPEHSVAFQSRLGRTPWIRPYTDEVLVQLAQQGTRRLLVFCSAFVADCLETLEEIGIRAREDFIAAGGEDLALVPAVNASDLWADGLTEMLRECAPWLGESVS